VEDLRRKYKQAIALAKTSGLTGFVGERDGRLFFKGSVQTHEDAVRLWHAIKDVPGWRNEVIADIQVVAPKPAGWGNTGDTPA